MFCVLRCFEVLCAKTLSVSVSLFVVSGRPVPGWNHHPNVLKPGHPLKYSLNRAPLRKWKWSAKGTFLHVIPLQNTDSVNFVHFRDWEKPLALLMLHVHMYCMLTHQETLTQNKQTVTNNANTGKALKRKHSTNTNTRRVLKGKYSIDKQWLYHMHVGNRFFKANQTVVHHQTRAEPKNTRRKFATNACHL